MKQQNTFHYDLGFVFLTIALILTGCSTQKNTAQSRTNARIEAGRNSSWDARVSEICAVLREKGIL